MITSIMSILSKRKYSRCQPYLKDEMIGRIRWFISNNQPIRFIGFWGIGPKKKANWADNASCKFLQELDNEVKQVYPPGIEFTFIFATQHGIHNGIEINDMLPYTKEMEEKFKHLDFKFIYLNSLWKKYKIGFEKIDIILGLEPDDWWSTIEHADLIEKNARIRNKKMNHILAAQKYYIMRNLEKEMLEKEFSGSIFHTYSDSRFRTVLPNMPTLHLYSRKGWCNSPWFVTEEIQHEMSRSAI